ncbi:sunset domain-containing protein [Paenarthrobacter nicotinovorans]|uniref:sunset domain-containing protein n=1 Tax=Paenarthrobacter nicotinovorans TaxID=29320 RepID=UPI0004B48937|nr:hypothetical protein [Paenarthrobacter nicotinovorans]
MDWIIWVIVIVLVVAIIWWLLNRNKSRNSSSTPAPAAMEPANTASLPDTAAAAAGVAGLAGVTNLGKAAAEGSGPTAGEPSGEPFEDPAPAVDESLADEPAQLKARRDQGAADAALSTDSGTVTDAGAGPVTDTDSDADAGAGAGADRTSPMGEVRDSPEAMSTEPQPAATPGLTVDEPVIAAPVVEEPEVGEPVVAEPTVNSDIVAADTVTSDTVNSGATVHSADAGDVDDWDAGTADPAGASEPAGASALAAKDEPAGEDATAATSESADKAEWETSWTDSSGTPVHHHEYTDVHSPTLPGAESAAAEDPATSGHLAADHPYGTGSSSTQADAYPVKASATAMTYYDEDTAGYEEVAADVWFESAAHAEAAGFRPPRRSRH